MHRAKLLEDFKVAFKTWIEVHNAKATITGLVVEWDVPSIQSAWNGWISSYETYAMEYRGQFYGEYQ